jgi:hypothetical protein
MFYHPGPAQDDIVSAKVRDKEPDVFLVISDTERDLSSVSHVVPRGYLPVEST